MGSFNTTDGPVGGILCHTQPEVVRLHPVISVTCWCHRAVEDERERRAVRPIRIYRASHLVARVLVGPWYQ